MLSDPTSVCLNTTTLSPYNSLNKDDTTGNITTKKIKLQNDVNCNSCICMNGKPKCSNLWCGLPNCLSNSNSSAANCANHEVCVPSLKESCLTPPCEPRGDCRALEPSRRVAPPKLPASTNCWPNQAVLNENCARLSILLENKRLPMGTTVEGFCSNLRTLLGIRLVKIMRMSESPLLIVLCDIKNGTTDTIEVTVVSEL